MWPLSWCWKPLSIDRYYILQCPDPTFQHLYLHPSQLPPRTEFNPTFIHNGMTFYDRAPGGKQSRVINLFGILVLEWGCQRFQRQQDRYKGTIPRQCASNFHHSINSTQRIYETYYLTSIPYIKEGKRVVEVERGDMLLSLTE